MADVAIHRWRLVAAGLLMQICLGILYSWSVFRGPLAQAYGWDKTVTIAPYRWSILFFTIAMVIAGFWQDRKGPRLVGSAGGLLLGAGCLLAAGFGSTPMGLNVSYGVVAGLGVGFAYVTPIATCIKWFPDKRGLVVGLAVLGFGVGSLVFAPLLEVLLGTDPARFTTTIPRTFLILAAIFLVVVIGCAQFYKVPPPGWTPPGWTPPAAAQGGQRVDYQPAQMLRTWQFYVLWLVYFLGASVGLTAIGEAAPLVRELAGQAALLSGGAALGIMSVFNGSGRLAWGAASDRLGRRHAILAMCALTALSCALVLAGATSLGRLLVGICVVGFCYGGFLAVMPALAADYYGARNVGANYGILYSAWGLAGFVVPGYFAPIIESAKQAGQVARGYDTMFYSLAGLALAGGVMALFARKPSAAAEPAREAARAPA